MANKKTKETYSLKIMKMTVLEFIARITLIIIASTAMYFIIWRCTGYDTSSFIWYFHQFATGFVQCLILIIGFFAFRKVR